jgi:hypothetical protein
VDSYRWLLIGAAVGFVAVLVLNDVLQFHIDGWVGALLTTLSAAIIGVLGPRLTATASA